MTEKASIKTLLNQTAHFDYISFDLFDTLMFRTFRVPEDVFDAVEYAFNTKNDLKLHGFRKKRYRAERRARKVCGFREITIDDIYNQLKYSMETAEQLKEFEKRIEIDNCVPNQVMIDFLHLQQSAGKNVIITTDMYLDKATIEKILDKIGVEHYRLFLSSDIGVTKVSGYLFPYILKTLGIAKDQIVHIGDNPVSDIQRAAEVGICAYERIVEKCNSVSYHPKRVNHSIVHQHIKELAERKCKEDSPEFRIGYSVLGPVILEFCNWVHEQQQRLQCDSILFVAREGYLLEKVYKMLYPEERNSVDYIQLNKNLLRLPMLYLDPTASQLMDTMPMRENYSVSELLENLYIEDKRDFLKRLGRHEDIQETSVLSRTAILAGEYDSFLDAVFAYLENKCREQYDALIHYLKEKQIAGHSILLVNNSINGNGQHMLETILSKTGLSGKIYGLQFVRSRKCRRCLGNRSTGWITDGGLPISYTMQFNRYALLLEHLMFEASGTAKYFAEAADGTIAVYCAEQGTEKKNNDVMLKIQNYALSYVCDYLKVFPLYMGNKIMMLMIELYENPFTVDAELLGSLYDADTDGDKQLTDAMEWRQAKMVISGENARLLRRTNRALHVNDAAKALISKMLFMMKR